MAHAMQEEPGALQLLRSCIGRNAKQCIHLNTSLLAQGVGQSECIIVRTRSDWHSRTGKHCAVKKPIAKSTALKQGDRVKIGGLVCNVGYNGRLALVHSCSGSRWHLRLEDGTKLAAMGSNLRSIRRLRGKQAFPSWDGSSDNGDKLALDSQNADAATSSARSLRAFSSDVGGSNDTDSADDQGKMHFGSSTNESEPSYNSDDSDGLRASDSSEQAPDGILDVSCAPQDETGDGHACGKEWWLDSTSTAWPEQVVLTLRPPAATVLPLMTRDGEPWQRPSYIALNATDLTSEDEQEGGLDKLGDVISQWMEEDMRYSLPFWECQPMCPMRICFSGPCCCRGQ